MGKNRGFSFIFISVVLCGVASVVKAWSAPSFYLKDCGDYEVNGKVSCDHGNCSLTLLPGSQAQTVLRLKVTPVLYPQYEASFVHARVRVSSLTDNPIVAEALDPVPRRVIPQWTQADLRKVQARKCGRRE